MDAVEPVPVRISSFDEHHPPAREWLDECVHCGFCLPTCPTYLLDGEEMDSPRGRIYLMDLASKGEILLDQTFGEHLDGCLGCLACVTACPSGVQYDKLLAATRPQMERHIPRSTPDRWLRRVIFGLFPYPRRLRAATFGGLLYQRLGLRRLARRSGVLARLPASVRALEALLPPVRVRALLDRPARFTPAVAPRRCWPPCVPRAVARPPARPGCRCPPSRSRSPPRPDPPPPHQGCRAATLAAAR